MLTRRALTVTTVAAACARPARAADPLTLFTADVRPLSNADGPRRGIVLEIVQEAARIVGRELRMTFLPFAEAMRRTQETPGALMAPLARSPQREADFAWIAKIIDVPQAMGTMANRPTVDLEAARVLGRVGVVRGGVQESYLRQQGFANLVIFAGGREIATALASGEVDAWYATATQIVVELQAIGRSDVRIGPTLQTAPAWLAANRSTDPIPVAAFAEAVAGLERSGASERVYRSYIGG
jgi:polar amino acid transport system substrate-binding protein